MKVLFVLHLFSQSRHFHSVFEEVLSRGHTLKVLGLHRAGRYQRPVKIPPHARHIKRVAYDLTVPPREDFWGRTAELFRASRNLLFYDEPGMDKASVFRRRAEGFGDPFLMSLRRRRVPASGWLRLAYAWAEAAIPPDPRVLDQLRAEAPDVVLVSPLIFHEAAWMTEYVKAANILGLPIGFPVFSWDNLTTKGTVHEAPDRIFVWNGIQKREAIALHGVDPETVDVLGAWRFDEFIRYAPRLSYEEFCRRNRFNPAAPTIFYVGSSPIVAATEQEFIHEWISAVRGASELDVRQANILIRPHPRNELAWWDAVENGNFERVRIQEISAQSLHETRDLFETLHHSHAVVGLVTSAMIEAALLGKPVHTILTSNAGEGQEGTVHFGYLTSAGGGLLHVAQDLDEHIAKLVPHMTRAGRTDERAAAFVRDFVDAPGGGSPTLLLVDAIERLAQKPKSPTPRSAGAKAATLALRTAMRVGVLPVGRRPPRIDRGAGPAI